MEARKREDITSKIHHGAISLDESCILITNSHLNILDEGAMRMGDYGFVVFHKGKGLLKGHGEQITRNLVLTRRPLKKFEPGATRSLREEENLWYLSPSSDGKSLVIAKGAEEDDLGNDIRPLLKITEKGEIHILQGKLVTERIQGRSGSHGPVHVNGYVHAKGYHGSFRTGTLKANGQHVPVLEGIKAIAAYRIVAVLDHPERGCILDCTVPIVPGKKKGKWDIQRSSSPWSRFFGGRKYNSIDVKVEVNPGENADDPPTFDILLRSRAEILDAKGLPATIHYKIEEVVGPAWFDRIDETDVEEEEEEETPVTFGGGLFGKTTNEAPPREERIKKEENKVEEEPDHDEDADDGFSFEEV